jgi:hypothetical protein
MNEVSVAAFSALMKPAASNRESVREFFGAYPVNRPTSCDFFTSIDGLGSDFLQTQIC